ncbi:MAG: amidohydrolase family protein [Pseudomonadales bacterium]
MSAAAGGPAPAPASMAMLIRQAELPDGGHADVRLRGGRIAALGSLSAEAGERVVDAGGCLLLPGLHDHHLHLYSLAAAGESLHCGPPEIRSAEDLAIALERRSRAATGWIRGFGYHESVAGELDRKWLDGAVPELPVRIQHRSGRLWVFNSAGLERLARSAASRGVPVPPVDPIRGQLYDADDTLHAALGSEPPDLRAVSSDLAACGVTGVTDMTPDNDRQTFDRLTRAQARGEFSQRLLMAGRTDLDRSAAGTPRAAIGPAKFHLHESALPPFERLCRSVAACHERERTVAFHCVTETELVYALAALTEVGSLPGDRIEHASVTPDALLAQIQTLGLTVVTQPNFVAERGEAYLADVPEADRPYLYRVRSFLAAGVPLAAGSDAPFGRPDPWFAMQAAVTRQTAGGRVLGAGESVSPEQALALFTGEPDRPAVSRVVAEGAAADLVLLDGPWRQVRAALSRERVRMTVAAGVVTYELSMRSAG